jgi:hypothetical protein
MNTYKRHRFPPDIISNPWQRRQINSSQGTIDDPLVDELATQPQRGFWGFYGFFRSLEIFLLVPLVAHLTSMVIFKKFPGS